MVIKNERLRYKKQRITWTRREKVLDIKAQNVQSFLEINNFLLIDVIAQIT